MTPLRSLTVDLTGLNDVTDTILGIGAVVALLFGWSRVLKPRLSKAWRATLGFIYSLVGREAIIDPVTEEVLVPAKPGLGLWMANQEHLANQNAKQMAELTETVATLAKVVEHQGRLDIVVEDHERRLTALEAARVEQLIARKESTAAYEAITAVAKGAADTVPDAPLANDDELE